MVSKIIISDVFEYKVKTTKTLAFRNIFNISRIVSYIATNGLPLNMFENCVTAVGLFSFYILIRNTLYI